MLSFWSQVPTSCSACVSIWKFLSPLRWENKEIIVQNRMNMEDDKKISNQKDSNKFSVTHEKWSCVLWSRRILLMNKLGYFCFIADHCFFLEPHSTSLYLMWYVIPLCIITNKQITFSIPKTIIIITFPAEFTTLAFVMSSHSVFLTILCHLVSGVA